MEEQSKIFISKVLGFFWIIFFVIQVIKDLITEISWVPVGRIFVRYYNKTISPVDYWMGVHLHVAMVILGFLVLWIFIYKQRFIFLDNRIYLIRILEVLFFCAFIFFYLFSFIPL